MSTAIYALSADPITYGHIDVIKRALRVFDRIVVGIGNNPAKKYTFSLIERVRLAESALRGLSVEVLPFEGLLVDFAYSKNIHTVLRGVRNGADFEFEQMLHDINYSQRMGIDTFLVIADQNLSHVSSSAVKELQAHNAKEILEYVPMSVKQALEERVCRQVRIGVTGEIGAGKSFFSKKYREYFHKRYRPSSAHPRLLGVIEADMDVIARGILTSGEDPVCTEVRRKIANQLCVPYVKNTTDIPTCENPINIKALSDKIFSNVGIRKMYDDLMIDPILYFLRKDYLSNRDNIVLIGSALLVDCNGLPIVNNNVIVVAADKDIRRKRLMQSRGYSEDETNRRMEAQLSTSEKTCVINECVETNSHGSMYVVNNNSDDISDQELEKVDSWIQSISHHLA